MNEPTRDLAVQQLNHSPALIGNCFSRRVKPKPISQFSRLSALYVDDLMGGRLKRYFDRIVDLVAAGTQTRAHCSVSCMIVAE